MPGSIAATLSLFAGMPGTLPVEVSATAGRSGRGDVAVRSPHAARQPVARRLEEPGIPYVFATGYREGVSIPEGFTDVPVVRKPVSGKALAGALATGFHKQG
ncbi:response regulator [Rhizobium mongolense]